MSDSAKGQILKKLKVEGWAETQHALAHYLSSLLPLPLGVLEILGEGGRVASNSGFCLSRKWGAR